MAGCSKSDHVENDHELRYYSCLLHKWWRKSYTPKCNPYEDSCKKVAKASTADK